MTTDGSARSLSGRCRVVRPSRRDRDVDCAALGETDRRLLTVLCAHRVVRQDQLERLFPDIPERTLRYRTRRLHDLGLMGRTRPYRERGSAPNHHWPTRRADCVMSGEPIPRGGERQRPNPLFLAHAAALTELYVTLTADAPAAGLSLFDYRREADAREPFEHLGRERALAPDALVILADEQDRKLGAFVELDLGTMSHARLRQKADLYAAYSDESAWHGRHPFLPALLFLTTSDVRARRFLTALDRALAHGPQTYGRRTLVAGAGALAFTPGRLLGGPCLACLDGDELATLRNVLNAARAPHDEELAERRREREADDEFSRLQSDGERDAKGREEQRRQQTAYLEWRDGAARQFVRRSGPVGRLTHSKEEFYPQLDRRLIRTCRECQEPIYPRLDDAHDGAKTAKPGACHFCGGAQYVTRPHTERTGSR